MPAYWMPCVLPPRNDIVHHSHGVERSQLRRGKLAREPTALEMKSALPLARIRHDLRHSSIPTHSERGGARAAGEGAERKTERPRLLIAPRNRNQRSPLCFSPPCRVCGRNFGANRGGEIPRLAEAKGGTYHRHLATKYYASSKLRVAALTPCPPHFSP